MDSHQMMLFYQRYLNFYVIKVAGTKELPLNPARLSEILTGCVHQTKNAPRGASFVVWL